MRMTENYKKVHLEKTGRLASLARGVTALFALAGRRWRIVLAAVVLLLLLGWGAYLRWARGWVLADWTGMVPYLDADGRLQRGKTLWDWLELLIIPAVLALAAFYFNRQERQNELKIAEERRKNDNEIADRRNQENVLQNYLDKMNELILDKRLLEVKEYPNAIIFGEFQDVAGEDGERRLPADLQAVWKLAQVRTVTALRQLDVERKDIIFQFLRDAGLADFVLVGASFKNADLNNAQMHEMNLSCANLSMANLYWAKLTGANLTGANLWGANLELADFQNANLCQADLRSARLVYANFREADLNRADLSAANMDKSFFNVAILQEATLDYADMNDANLNGANLYRASLRATQLCRTYLYETILTEANLIHANLSDVILVNADLENASFLEAFMDGADLRGAKVSKRQLSEAKSLKNATMPDANAFDPAA